MQPSAMDYDPTQYLGSARHYLVGRPPYSAELGAVLASELGLDGTLLEARTTTGRFRDWPGDTAVIVARKPG
jgi:hypothetical protein